MTNQSILHALLIGIDCYMGHTIDGLPNYTHLRGCVRDIELMENFLTTRLTGPTVHLTKLTASGAGKQPKEPETQWPTKANIVAAFQKLAQDAQAGDQVYIHYSGHGGQAVTLYRKAKGDDGLDESLVPTDYGQIENKTEPEDRYLRDLELASLLQALVDKQALVTVVLDSCHSGGASRGIDPGEDGPTVRGSGEVDRVQRTPVNLVASPAELMAGWQKQSRGTRSAQVAAGWLPDPDGYTLFSACRALELATEAPMPNGKRHGYLTYWLWDALQRPMRNWEMVHQQVASRVKGLNPSQTPQIQGVGDRAVFGGATVSLPSAVNVLKVQGDRLQLDVGLSGGAALGAQYFVYPSGVTNFKETEKRLAMVEVIESHNADSWAIIRSRPESAADKPIEPGAQALLFNPGASQQRSVGLLREVVVPAAVESAALETLTMTLIEGENRFVRLAAEGENAHFLVAVTGKNTYELRDSQGQPIPYLPVAAIDNPAEIAYQLTHLTKYLNVMALNNPNLVSSLAGKLEVTLMETPERAFHAPGGIPTVKSGEDIYYLRIRNSFEPLPGPPSDAPGYIEQTRRRTLNITVLNLSPEWEISRIIPTPGEAANQIELGPGQTLLIPRFDLPGEPMQLPAFQSVLPRGATEAEDIIKVFATTETVNSYDSLQLPALRDTGRRAALLGPKPQQPEELWIAAQVSVRVVKA